MGIIMDINLKGKKAIVTGGTGQLGRCIVRTLAECGADVAIHYHQNRDKAEELVAELRAVGRTAGAFQADITNEQSIYEMRDKVYEEFGKPDIIVNNAVIQYTWRNVLEQDPADYISQFESCVMHNVYMNKAFIPHLIEQQYGRIIVMNTESAALADAGSSAYVAGKRGLDGLVRCLSKEIGKYNITVNQVAPGWTISEKDRIQHSEIQPDYDKTVPLRHRGIDQDIANMVCFLASDLAAFTTGAYIPVCGGRVMPAI
jgi:3-oxoacyl-[acyl-carrier protein] reductase